MLSRFFSNYVLTKVRSHIKINEYVYIETVRVRLQCNKINFNSITLEVYRLANIKSAKKRILVTETKTARNKAIKSRVKTYVKKVETAVAENNKEAASAALLEAISEINKAASKGVYHKNTAARKVSRLTKAVNKIA